jgi:hypothetical protein
VEAGVVDPVTVSVAALLAALPEAFDVCARN